MSKRLCAAMAAVLLAVLLGCGQPAGATPSPTSSTPTNVPPPPTDTRGSPKPSLEVPPPIY